jgi:hypothetical protein
MMVERILEAEKSSISSKQPVNMFPWQLKHAPVSIIPGPSLGNSLLNTSLNNIENLGSYVFYVVCAKVTSKHAIQVN